MVIDNNNITPVLQLSIHCGGKCPQIQSNSKIDINYIHSINRLMEPRVADKVWPEVSRSTSPGNVLVRNVCIKLLFCRSGIINDKIVRAKLNINLRNRSILNNNQQEWTNKLYKKTIK